MGLLNRPALTDRCVRRSSHSDSSVLHATTTTNRSQTAPSLLRPVSCASWRSSCRCWPSLCLAGLSMVSFCLRTSAGSSTAPMFGIRNVSVSTTPPSRRDGLSASDPNEYRARASCRSPSRSHNDTPLNERAMRKIDSLGLACILQYRDLPLVLFYPQTPAHSTFVSRVLSVARRPRPSCLLFIIFAHSHFS